MLFKILRRLLRRSFSRKYTRRNSQKSISIMVGTVVNMVRQSSVHKDDETVTIRTATTIAAEVALPQIMTGKCYVVDGDTIKIRNISLRLAGIDAPELDHPWGQQAKWHLAKLCKGNVIRAELSPELSYDRVVAACYLPDGTDLSAEMVQAGLALDWPKFSSGKYAHLEPENARKKHWKAAARQRGDMDVFNK